MNGERLMLLIIVIIDITSIRLLIPMIGYMLY